MKRAIMVFVDILVSSAIALVTFFTALTISDGDLSLMYCEKFGRKLGRIKNQVIWITGASSGIGAALALEAAKHGAKLVLSARSVDRLENVKRQCIEAGKDHKLAEDDVLVLPMDLCKLDDHQTCFDKVMEYFGKLNIMVHNAGRYQMGNWEKIDLAVDKDIFDVNVFASVHLTRLIIPYFLKQGGGDFAVVSSLAGLAGMPYSAAYTASKHALHGYFESLRNEELGTGISVTILCPGQTVTNLLDGAATEKAGEVHHGSMTVGHKRMSAERCAQLCLVAIAHQLEVAWITFFPILPGLYFNQYLPTITKRLINYFGSRHMRSSRDKAELIERDTS